MGFSHSIPLVEAEGQTSYAIRCLRSHQGVISVTGTALEQVLGQIHDIQIDAQGDAAGLYILVEDIHPGHVEALGSALGIEPSFFYEHLAETHFYQLEKRPIANYMSSLPSRFSSNDVAHFHYQRVIDLGGDSSTQKLPYHLHLDGNLKRQVRRLPPLSDRYIGLARSCFSIVRKELKQGRWICVMLMDSNSVDVMSDDTQFGEAAFRIPQASYRTPLDELGSSPTCHHPASQPPSQTQRSRTILEEIATLLLNRPAVPSGDVPSLVELAQHPMEIIVAEWMLYSHLIGRCTKHYEFSFQKVEKRLNLELDEVLVELYRWRRRSQQSLNKVWATRWFLDHHEHRNTASELLSQDLSHISDQIDHHRGALESMVPVLTSMIQLVETRRAMEEMIYVKHLTYIALVFLPLSYVATLFSMSDRFAVDSGGFVIYLLSAVSLLVVVLLISRFSFVLDLGMKRVESQVSRWFSRV